MPKTAAILVIGNEVLSGKVRDENAAYLIPRLRQLGVELRRVATVPDEVPVISREIREGVASVDHLFCSGGIGPTHDDVTVEAVAAALEVPVETSDQLEELVRRHHRERRGDEPLSAAALRLARVPRGARLISRADIWYPIIAVKEIYLLPGVPMLFRLQFDALADRFRDSPFFLRSLYLSSGEVAITERLDGVVARHPEVSIGSYPRFDAEADYRVKLTVESRDRGRVDLAFQDLRSSMPPEVILRED